MVERSTLCSLADVSLDLQEGHITSLRDLLAKVDNPPSELLDLLPTDTDEITVALLCSSLSVVDEDFGISLLKEVILADIINKVTPYCGYFPDSVGSDIDLSGATAGLSFLEGLVLELEETSKVELLTFVFKEMSHTFEVIDKTEEKADDYFNNNEKVSLTDIKDIVGQVSRLVESIQTVNPLLNQ